MSLARSRPLWLRLLPRLPPPPGRPATSRLLSTAPVRLEPQLESIISRFQTNLKATRSESAEKSKTLVDDFGQLQRVRVQNVLLVCSVYDSYTFEEDGLLNEQLHQVYAEHSLTKPPAIDRVSSPELALQMFKERGNYDMVVMLARMANASNLVNDIVRLNPACPIAMLALNSSELTSLGPHIDASQRLNVNKRLMWETAKAGIQGDGGGAKPTAAAMQDAWVWPFMWHGQPSLFTAMFKAVEDRLNARADVEYGVQIVIVVEDSVDFYSSYLPVLYAELWRQNKAIQVETMNQGERMLRMHSRPKVLFCTNYEEALDIYDRYRDNVSGVITDLGFPQGGSHNQTAGLQFAAHIRETTPQVPVLMQSAMPDDSAHADAARALGLKYVCKSDEALLQGLRDFMLNDLMFGPLQFTDPEGHELGKVSNVTEMMKVWADLPLDSVAHHARHAHLSRWFFGRAEFALAKRFRDSVYPADFIDDAGKERPDWLRNWILTEVRNHRNKLASTVENANTADESTPIVRYGTGSLGGKGRGFRFLHNLFDKFNMQSVIPDMELHVPRCFVLATSVFEDFLDDNELLVPALNATTDQQVVALFAEAELRHDVRDSLRRFLTTSTGPLAVRSSSLFEDAFMQPFAGIYETVMLPNATPSLDERLLQLEDAVKRVYASTYSQRARAYASSVQNRTEAEKMAVILQPLVGESTSSGHFHPTLAGVANSVDFYPLPHTSSSHGCAQVGLGLGIGVVDGSPAVHFSLGDPASLTGPDPMEMPLTALHLHASSAEDMVVELPNAASSLTTVPRADTVAMAPEAASSVPLSQDVHGEQVVFSKGYGKVVAETPSATGSAAESAELRQVPLRDLLAGEAPVAKALSFLLRLGSSGLGCPVELEFAFKARQSAHAKHELHLLQIRPQAQFQELSADRFQFLPSADYAAVASTRALGHGRFENLMDVVYVSPERFDPQSTAAIAAEIGEINATFQKEGRKYLLMAPGRWGSADAATGIPVAWQDIDQSAVIVETTLDKHIPVSQGSHFFQNIISFGLGYMTVDPSADAKSEVADYSYWEGHTDVPHGTKYVRHVRLADPLEVVVDGQSRHGVVMKMGKPFDVYVGQVNAFMALAQEQQNSSN